MHQTWQTRWVSTRTYRSLNVWYQGLTTGKTKVRPYYKFYRAEEVNRLIVSKHCKMWLYDVKCGREFHRKEIFLSITVQFKFGPTILGPNATHVNKFMVYYHPIPYSSTLSLPFKFSKICFKKSNQPLPTFCKRIETNHVLLFVWKQFRGFKIAKFELFKTIVSLRCVTLYGTATWVAEEYNRFNCWISHSKGSLNGIHVAVAYNVTNRKLTNIAWWSVEILHNLYVHSIGYKW